ncbi:MAG TPA: geranylgeranyl reductase family protein [Candidatus Corynebacterium gallistercoris]|uniref:Geranylgeranyl reductase family protein n=1 Tax=Candidatus Corynebacterium gallistercoris TaxID=2838530 RepID=A0A9D1RZZ0_9CORY|nr:geranylgeranyl reductase family protein [Candidatus Corynebacterium gallistercoris]
MNTPPPAHASSLPRSTDVLVIGAGPAGSAAALAAARAGYDTTIVDMAEFLPAGRDKTCGDGLTPRAVHALEAMGAGHLLTGAPHIKGLKLHGFGGSVTAPWPTSGAFPARGSAIARVDFDVAVLRLAIAAGATFVGGFKCDATAATHPNSITEIHGSFTGGERASVRARWVIVAEGVRSGVAKKLGVTWHRGLVHGVAARSYVTTPHSNEPWIHSHLELRDGEGTAQPGYGWVFPLGGSAANLGCGALVTTARPAKVNTKKLLRQYAEQVRGEWGIEGEPQRVTSALLPMGGAVSRVAGRNWAVIGDAAALVNPLNGEGIDYGLESGRMVVELLADAGRNPEGLRYMWPALLREEYGSAFSLARRLAMVLTMPGLMSALGPVGMRGPLAQPVMGAAARLMGNLVTSEDKDLAGRLWLAAGRLSRGVDRLVAADARPLFGVDR